ncbi:polyprenyl synthetase family protein [Marihabitans asiaticum]|uniref:Geranylgeranyl diphosphate synthase type II n=1 Tax=Marihabitans asiaticum TaxID=415218 RepID=A0A560WAE1_9MICO|nr:polyprenyl synthetase family protein [Marihabitans asiaticum]TWD14520.1 geranylgeranyl diphosphate synthase type II [Marihabitans asiaticum]
MTAGTQADRPADPLSRPTSDAGGRRPELRDGQALEEALKSAQSGGKRFRPRLVRSVHDLLGGDAGPAVDQVADAVELLHTAFVVHDDVIDGDDLRRGAPSAPGRFRAAAIRGGAATGPAGSYATAGAILTGDLALGAALRAVATAPVAREQVHRMLELFDHALAVSAAGELADVRLSLGAREPTLEEALAVAEQKTAVYSFSLPMQCGAVLAGARASVVDGLGRIGRDLGLAFQLIDDLTGVFGAPAQTGKGEIAGDLREGKRTPLVVHARSTPAWPVVERHLGDPTLDEQGVARVRAALTDAGSRSFVSDLALERLRTASVRAADLGLPPELVAWVRELSGSLQEGAE